MKILLSHPNPLVSPCPPLYSYIPPSSAGAQSRTLSSDEMLVGQDVPQGKGQPPWCAVLFADNQAGCHNFDNCPFKHDVEVTKSKKTQAWVLFDKTCFVCQWDGTEKSQLYSTFLLLFLLLFEIHSFMPHFVVVQKISPSWLRDRSRGFILGRFDNLPLPLVSQ